MINLGITKNMISAAETVFLAMAYTETVREIIEPIQKRVLLDSKYEIEKEWRAYEAFTVITNIKDSFLMSSDNMQDFCKKLNVEYLKAGFKVEGTCCPLLIAENLELTAKRSMLESMEPVTKCPTEQILCSLTRYDKMIELTLGLMAPFCKAGNIKSLISN